MWLSQSSLCGRAVRPELMDQPGLAARDLHRALEGLARLNWCSGASRPFRRPVENVARSIQGRAVRILDVGSGGGDVPVALGSWLVRRAVPVELTLCDRNPTSLAMARKRAAARGVVAGALVRDVTTDTLPAGFDVVISSLFLHHLEWGAAVEVLRLMARSAGRLVVVCDLRRGLASLLLAGGATRALSRSRVVRTDALLSVRAAFTVEEARRLAQEAGLQGATVHRCWPQRWCLVWRRR